MVDQNVTYRIRGDASEFTRVVKRAEATMSGSFRNMSTASDRGSRAIAGDYNAITRAADGAQLKVKGLVTAIGGIALGGAGLTAFANSALNTADAIAKTSERLGITTDELQKYQFAFDKAGVSAETFNKAFQGFGRRLGEAAQGAGEARPALDALGISVKNVDGTLRPVNQVFDEAITKLSQVEDVTLRNALAMKLFDSEGVALVQIGDNLEKMKQAAEDLGLIIPEELLRNAEGLNDKLSILQQTISTKLTVALLKFTPQIEALINGAISAADNFDEVAETLADIAKIVVAMKLIPLISGLYGVAGASIAAARGLNAARIAMNALKFASIVGIAFYAVEKGLEAILNSVDSTAEEIESSINNAVETYVTGTDKMAAASEEGAQKITAARLTYGEDLEKLVKAEVKTLEEGLKAQEAVVKEQRNLLKDATRDAQKAADEFVKAFDQIRGKNAEIEDPSLLDFSSQITEARRLLSQGDNEGAVNAALAAKDIVLALQETGKYTEAQLTGTLKKAQQVQEVASGALVSEQEQSLSQAETALQKIQSQLNLVKSMTFEFDETKSLAGAKKVIDQIKRLVETQPIVVPVELRPTNGLDLGSTSAPGYATGGFIRGPGTTTSDSILARVSRGEYIINAAMVDKYGVDFMNALNAGRLPAFASGGLVQAPAGGSTGTPVHLNLGGRSYPMSASPQIAAQLRRETHMEQLKKGRRS